MQFLIYVCSWVSTCYVLKPLFFAGQKIEQISFLKKCRETWRLKILERFFIPYPHFQARLHCSISVKQKKLDFKDLLWEIILYYFMLPLQSISMILKPILIGYSSYLTSILLKGQFYFPPSSGLFHRSPSSLTMVLKPQSVLDSPGGLVKTQKCPNSETQRS